jgi:hypothetical protein
LTFHLTILFTRQHSELHRSTYRRIILVELVELIMPSAPVLRLTVLVLPREQVSTYSSFFRASNEQQHRAEPAKPRTLLLVIKDPENVSLGQLANLIKDLWLELWPAEG